MKFETMSQLREFAEKLNKKGFTGTHILSITIKDVSLISNFAKTLINEKEQRLVENNKKITINLMPKQNMSDCYTNRMNYKTDFDNTIKFIEQYL